MHQNLDKLKFFFYHKDSLSGVERDHFCFDCIGNECGDGSFVAPSDLVCVTEVLKDAYHILVLRKSDSEGR